MTRNKLKRLIKEVLSETGGWRNVVAEPNTPGRTVKSDGEMFSISNFTTHRLKISVKRMSSSGVSFIDIREA